MNIKKNGLNKIRRYDEYYTKYEHVVGIFDNYIDKTELKDKIIYCPCDSDKSNFVVYLKEHKEDIGYKELIYTSDDYNTHLDLFERCDIVITNPPFSKLLKEFIPILNKVNKKFFILGSMVNMRLYYKYFNDKENVKFLRPNKYFDFDMPKDSNLTNNPMFTYVSNMNVTDNYNKYIKLFQKMETSDIKCLKYKDNITNEIKECDIRNYDRIPDIPTYESGNMVLVPSTVLWEHNRKYFDIIEIFNSVEYSDYKSRFVRMLVKVK